MKQKIVIKVELGCEKCRTKAMRVTASTPIGIINSMSVDGEEKDKLVVIGVDVDVISLTNALRKKLPHRCADIVSVDEVKNEKEAVEEPKPNPPNIYPCPWYPYPWYQPQFYAYSFH